MGKLIENLQKQLNTEYRDDANECIQIYDPLNEITGHVWDTNWRVLVSVIYKGYPSNEKRYKPTKIGYIFLNGLKKTK